MVAIFEALTIGDIISTKKVLKSESFKEGNPLFKSYVSKGHIPKGIIVSKLAIPLVPLALTPYMTPQADLISSIILMCGNIFLGVGVARNTYFWQKDIHNKIKVIK